jgi:hypothetical protein
LFANMFNTHPPMAERIAALKQMSWNLQGSTLKVKATSQARRFPDKITLWKLIVN